MYENSVEVFSQCDVFFHHSSVLVARELEELEELEEGEEVVTDNDKKVCLPTTKLR